MAEALEAEAADVPDAPQEFGPSRVTTQEKVGKSAILSQGRPSLTFTRAPSTPLVPVPYNINKRRRWLRDSLASSFASIVPSIRVVCTITPVAL
ncbi:predicted protein [Pyrenophora tritici-repentis Pt-1C-BFP]|uniref:Uncharacterized protein n=1 Tax=Pyrenophora tritici-repentis (strain Pt-1C-BFP) TaxID=426418 RepID=B2W9E3_PYRTR|nr:uncharacterized protein PTRG_06601 [Pyrenophora tritici-repentis Pt-1C-BFP]EDU49521.1 predicted protein [Pyrenophora tritici-repentis Pt-1C-BFP]